MNGLPFAAPAILFLLFGLLLFGWRLLKQHREQVEHVLAVGNVNWNRTILRGRNGRFRQHLLWLAGMSCLLVALARPQWGNEVILVESSGVQLMVVLDLSQSMLVEDGRGSRLELAKGVVETAVSALGPKDEVGLLVFAGEQQLWLPLTHVQSQLDAMLSRAHPQQLVQQGTLLARAVETAVRAFPMPHEGQAVMLILTDGEDHGIGVQQAAQIAAASNVILLTVGLGSSEGGPVPLSGNQPGYKLDADGLPVISRPDEAVLKTVAEVGNGRFLPATEANRLPNILNEIRTQHTGLEKVVRPVERYQLFLLASVAIFGMAAGMLVLAEIRLHQVVNRTKWVFFLICLFAVGLLTACRTPDGAALIAEGNAAFEQGTYEQALKAYQQAGELGEETAVSQYNLANTHYRMAQYSNAATALQTVNSFAALALGTNAHFNLGNTHFQQEQYEEAIAAYQSVLRQTPNDMDAKHNLELALQQLLSESEAAPDLQKPAESEEANSDGVPTAGLPDEGDGGGVKTAVSLQTAQELLSSAVESAITLPVEHAERKNDSSSAQHAKDW